MNRDVYLTNSEHLLILFLEEEHHDGIRSR